ncbi:glutamate mutase [Nocardioides marmoriginsengisoli]|uniref:Glutamate mutase n=1 Tax=Nocardioides marmoriginsengisoli TaxID=661483 RepID=A0A3N0CCW3_9ACTN|nr:glutamate mutase L [Nocardioides marmoriginsengisoli]RNL61292.1 glutamate mutase [Nocardioides marmoriginsengisoli]
MPDLVVCVDFGSTFTKAALVDRAAGRLLATTQHPTTSGTDVLDGYDACLAALAAEHPEVAHAETLACSSAGGGLRIAVVGNEDLVTAEAGRRVALSSGGKVVAVLAGGLDDARFTELVAARPDVLLLVGGTDGGNAATLVADAGFLAARSWAGPVVVAGDVDSQDVVAGSFEGSGTPYLLADNVVPRIGVLAPESARAAIREVFLAHVIGGKNLSSRPEFAAMVLGATPDVVLTGVELLAAVHGSSAPGTGVVVVDVGGATTDVHSVVTLDPEETALAREVVAVTPTTRTVEGDLGMRWSAVSTAEEAIAAGLADEDLRTAAVRRGDDPGLVPADPADAADDLRLAGAAAVLAMRRHVGRSVVVLSPEGRVVERSGKNLRAVDLLVGSGGVFRAAADAVPVLSAATGVDPDGWQLPEHPRIVVDEASVLAAAGLIALAGGDAAALRSAQLLICNNVSGVDQHGGASQEGAP